MDATTSRNLDLYRKLETRFPDLVEYLRMNDPEHDPSFLGFINTYYYLSKLIPKHWTVVDIGC